jgi:hypothetical protein
MIGRCPGDINMFIGNLFPEPMLSYIHMFELGDERWQVLSKQPYGLLIVAINNEVVVKLKPDILEQPIPPKSLRCRM